MKYYQNIKLSSSEIRFFFQEQFYPKQDLFNECGGIFINGNLDNEILIHSLRINIHRNELLRAFVTIKNEIPYFEINDVSLVDIRSIDINIDIPDKIAFIEHFPCINRKYKLTEPSFSLFEPPLIGVSVLNFNDTSSIIIVMHHIISDGYYTNKYFFENLSIIYDKLCSSGYGRSLCISSSEKLYTGTCDNYQSMYASHRLNDNIEKYLYPGYINEDKIKVFWQGYLKGYNSSNSLIQRNNHLTNHYYEQVDLINISQKIKLIFENISIYHEWEVMEKSNF